MALPLYFFCIYPPKSPAKDVSRQVFNGPRFPGQVVVESVDTGSKHLDQDVPGFVSISSYLSTFHPQIHGLLLLSLSWRFFFPITFNVYPNFRSKNLLGTEGEVRSAFPSDVPSDIDGIYYQSEAVHDNDCQ
jgi:hypothetical protein